MELFTEGVYKTKRSYYQNKVVNGQITLDDVLSKMGSIWGWRSYINNITKNITDEEPSGSITFSYKFPNIASHYALGDDDIAIAFGSVHVEYINKYTVSYGSGSVRNFTAVGKLNYQEACVHYKGNNDTIPLPGYFELYFDKDSYIGRYKFNTQPDDWSAECIQWLNNRNEKNLGHLLILVHPSFAGAHTKTVGEFWMHPHNADPSKLEVLYRGQHQTFEYDTSTYTTDDYGTNGLAVFELSSPNNDQGYVRVNMRDYYDADTESIINKLTDVLDSVYVRC